MAMGVNPYGGMAAPAPAPAANPFMQAPAGYPPAMAAGYPPAMAAGYPPAMAAGYPPAMAAPPSAVAAAPAQPQG